MLLLKLLFLLRFKQSLRSQLLLEMGREIAQFECERTTREVTGPGARERLVGIRIGAKATRRSRGRK
jgi:hypothetical protein